ncbi:MAG TPA: class I SAM-dependent methyltransferase [Candidatus Limnocylindrales bacterium]
MREPPDRSTDPPSEPRLPAARDLASRRLFFDHAYEGRPTWDIGRPQGAVVRLVEAGLVAGPVLDVGCGTGANARYLAALGHRVVGLDFAPAAIAAARAAAVSGTDVRFVEGDALRLTELAPRLGGPFATTLDIGLFHTLQPADRSAYAAGLAGVVRPGGRALVLCWSDRNPFGLGPERIRRADLRAAFRRPWAIEAIAPETLETLLPDRVVHAWLAVISRR